MGFGGTNTFIGVQSGVDYVAYSGAASAYTIAADSTGFRVNRPDGGHDELISIKGVYFSDATVLLSGSGSTSTVMKTDYPQINANTVGLYRFFNKLDGTHFFTSSTTEANQVAESRSDMAFEGIGLRALNPSSTSTDGSATAAYRFFDKVHGTHFYTTSQSEQQAILNTRADLAPEGVAFYAHTFQKSGDTAVYRFFDTVNGTHFYTSSSAEASSIVSNRTDLKAEGIGFYVPSN